MAKPQTSVRPLSFRRLGDSEVHARFLEDDPDLAGLFPPKRREPAEILRSLPVGARRLVPRKKLSQALLAYAERHGAGPASLAAAARAEQEDAVFVVTGQQPGLFGGPLYVLHKIATAIELCRRMAETPGSPPVIPLFWNHSEDHDWGEVNHTFLVNPAQDLQRIRLDVVHQGQAIRDVPVARPLESALAAAAEIMPVTEFREEMLDLFRPRDPAETLGSACARLYFKLFEKHDLLVIEPRDLPSEAFEALARWWPMSEQIRSAVRKTAEQITDIDLDVTVDLDGPLFFARTGERRLPLPDGDPLPRPDLCSPGVLLRPLWQDACLPTAAYVCGPGELAYLMLSQPLYKLLGVPVPSLVPRASITLVEPSLQKLLSRFSWDLPDLAVGPEKLAGSRSRGSGDTYVEERIEELADHAGRTLAGLEEPTQALDAGLLGPLSRTRQKVLEELGKLAAKVRNHRQNQEGTGLRQIRRVCANLRPRGLLQERVLPPLPFLMLHGRSLIPIVLSAADPFAQNHLVVEL